MLFASHLDVPWDTARWPNFRPAELACKCRSRFCRGEYWHDPVFLDALQGMRSSLGKLRITSGHRCPLWNASVSGAPLSMHRKIAADVCLLGHDRQKVLAMAIHHGFTGLGLAQTFLHIDRRASPATWFYGPLSRKAWS